MDSGWVEAPKPTFYIRLCEYSKQNQKWDNIKDYQRAIITT